MTFLHRLQQAYITPLGDSRSNREMLGSSNYGQINPQLVYFVKSDAALHSRNTKTAQLHAGVKTTMDNVIHQVACSTK